MKQSTCKHCGKSIFLDAGIWKTFSWIPKPDAQYCWIDPAQGSQRHEPKDIKA
jgi:hypothetical protein